MVPKKSTWKIHIEELPFSEEARGPRLEPGSERGLAGRHLLAGLDTEPGQAQPEEALWHPPYILWAHRPWEEPWESGALPHWWQ